MYKLFRPFRGLVAGLLAVSLLIACSGGDSGGGGGSSSGPTAPSITLQPSAASIYTTQAATFSVAASDPGTLAYQWRKAGINISGATSSNYTTPATTLADNGAQYSVVVTGSGGSTASNNATLTVADASPGISSQPAAQSVYDGQSAAFLVQGSGMPTLSYQWRKNSVNIPGQVFFSYNIPATTIADNGANYSVVITNAHGSIISNNALLSVAGTAPSITTHPAAQSVSLGQSAVFNVGATGTATLNYQWRKNSVNISGATSASYTTPAITAGDYGALFSVVVTNTYGTATSNSAAVTAGGGFNAASNCAFADTSSGNDPLLSYQWHIKNNSSYFASNAPAIGAGIDLCMGGLWAAGTTGVGVKVNVVDTGLEIAHEDLSTRIIAGGSYNFVTLTSNPTNSATTGDHGTSVAGLIAATKGNSVGGTGIAPAASLQGYNLLLSSQSLTQLGIAFGSNSTYNASNSDIFNFSAGVTSNTLYTPSTSNDTIVRYMETLRSFKGGIFVKSAGNGFKSLGSGVGNTSYCLASGVTCQSANQDDFNTQYNAIVVASLNPDGTKSSYSSTGSSIWVSGFGGEYGYDVAVAGSGYITDAYKPAMVTTDQSSCSSGYSRSGINNNLLDKGDGTGTGNSSCNYTAGFNGTSSAAPTVSGVIALMLQANPALTWRDIRHILATTSRRVNSAQSAITNSTYFGTAFTLEQGWVLNAGGYWYHNWYGFGLVNAAAAVAMAQTYTAGSLGNFVAETKQAASAPTSIPFGSAGLTKTFSIAGTAPSIVEQAELTLYFDIGYQPICHQIELTSPSGTKSIVLNMDSAHTAVSNNGVRFMSNAFYGESAVGTWTLRFINSCTAQSLSNLANQQLTIRGR
jgi:subtilisin family serine protease